MAVNPLYNRSAVILALTSSQPSSHERFADLEKTHRRQVYNLALKLTENYADAEDLTQDTFLRALRSFDQYKQEFPFIKWISKIAVRLSIDEHDRKKRSPRTISIDEPIAGNDDNLFFQIRDAGPTPEETFLTDSHFDKIGKAMALIKPELRCAIVAVDVEGLSYKEAAELLGCSPGAMRVRLHRGRNIIRGMLPELAKGRSQQLNRDESPSVKSKSQDIVPGP